MSHKILAFLEQRDGLLKKTAAEVISTAKRISEELNSDFEAVVIGNEINNIDSISSFGLKYLKVFKHPDLENYSSSAYTKILSEYAAESSADILIFANSAMGNDLAPGTAVRLNAGILTDCIELKVVEGKIEAVRPVYAGKALMRARLSSVKHVYTIRPNVFKPVNINGASPEIKIVSVTHPDLRTRVTSFKKSEGKIDVAEADIIVSGGRGLKGPENFYLIENLASELNAAVGASRAVVDAGWRPHREQVGQTGKTVSPSLYIACGISGAIQHLAGMSSSKYIVAINKDKDAPIFSVADYGIAGDIFEILPALTEEIRKLK